MDASAGGSGATSIFCFSRFHLLSNSIFEYWRRLSDRNDFVIFKTSILMLIMVTGAIWEKVVFGQYLLAPAFFWEDIVSFFVIFLHIAYVLALWINLFSEQQLMLLALVAYVAYFVNALQFLIKLRAARMQSAWEDAHA